MFEQVLESLVGIECRAEARELAHRPHLSAISRRVNAARVRRLTRKAKLRFIIEIGNAVWRVEPFDGNKRCGGETLFALGTSLERRLQRALFPLALGFL